MLGRERLDFDIGAEQFAAFFAVPKRMIPYQKQKAGSPSSGISGRAAFCFLHYFLEVRARYRS
jgi:hypothetical protein